MYKISEEPVRCIHETEGAILVAAAGAEDGAAAGWVPKVSLHEDSEVWTSTGTEGTEGKLVCRATFAARLEIEIEVPFDDYTDRFDR